MRRMLAEDIELTLEVLGVKRTAPGGVALSVVRAEDHERLKNRGLFTRGRGTKDGAISGNLPPAEDAESQIAGDLGENSLLLLEADGVVCLEKDVTNSVLPGFWELTADLAFGFPLEEGMGDAGHDTRTVAIAAVCTGGAAVSHGAEKLTSI